MSDKHIDTKVRDDIDCRLAEVEFSLASIEAALHFQKLAAAPAIPGQPCNETFTTVTTSRTRDKKGIIQAYTMGLVIATAICSTNAECKVPKFVKYAEIKVVAGNQWEITIEWQCTGAS